MPALSRTRTQHVELATRQISDLQTVRASIVNPGKLSPERRDDICHSCHLQPSVELFGVRRFGTPDYAFRPGQALADYLVLVDVEEEGRARADRFEINHHPYRLRQSRCFLASKKLSCLTCHDPHRKVPPSERLAHYRAACLSCHSAAACRLPEMATQSAPAGIVADDCVACHMPQRRPSDVIHTVMTDHWIRRRPGGPELVAPREKEPPSVFVGMEFLFPDSAPQGQLGEVYKSVAVLRAASGTAALEHLERSLAAARPESPEPWLDLAQAQIQHGRFAAADLTLSRFLARFPRDPLAREWQAITQARLGAEDRGVETLRELVEEQPERPEAWFNLGLFQLSQGEVEAATSALERALALRPNLVSGWFYLARARAARGQLELAAAAYRQALAVDPGNERAYLDYGELLLRRGERAEALRWWCHGRAVARRPELLAGRCE